MTATVHQLASRRVNRTVKLTRTPNADMRPSGESLSDEQVRRLIKAARGNRYGQRDALMIELAWQHGLRASELCGLSIGSIPLKLDRGTVTEIIRLHLDIRDASWRTAIAKRLHIKRS
jgi:integrase